MKSSKTGTISNQEGAYSISTEESMELAIEFQRWFDLKRTNRAIPVLTAKGKAITQTKLLLPIPQIVRLQSEAIGQNPGH